MLFSFFLSVTPRPDESFAFALKDKPQMCTIQTQFGLLPDRQLLTTFIASFPDTSSDSLPEMHDITKFSYSTNALSAKNSMPQQQGLINQNYQNKNRKSSSSWPSKMRSSGRAPGLEQLGAVEDATLRGR